MCDGMGGLSKGEAASASVIRRFDEWFENEFPALCTKPLEDATIRKMWLRIVSEMNDRIRNYGRRFGSLIGTTVAVLLLTENRYYILNAGDSRVYEISDRVKQITQDHTLVALDVASKKMTEEQARVDPRRNQLYQCVGVAETVQPDFFFGETNGNAVYMLCTDGFRHEITSEEMYEKLSPNVLLDEHIMDAHAEELIELNKARMERDNISVALIRTF